MTRGALLLSLTAIACLPLACGDAFSNGGDTSSAGDGGGAVTNAGSGAGGGGIGTGGMPNQGMCPDGSYEVPEVPSDWQGPIMVWQRQADGQAPACPTEELELDLFNGLDGGSVDCNCDCTTPSTSNCSAQLMAHGSNDLSCQGAGTLVATLTPNAPCQAVAFDNTDNLSWEAQPACSPEANNTIDVPVWGGVIRACTLPTTDNMGTTCANPEDPFDNRICIVREGYHECPEDFPQQTKVWNDYDDGRHCTDCTCDTSKGMCGGSVVFYGDNNCSALDQNALYPSECETHSSAARATYNAALQMGADCPPNPTLPQGELTATGEHVICCTN